MKNNFEIVDSKIDKNNSFGMAGVTDIVVPDDALDDAISEIVLNFDNLKFLFSIKKAFLNKDEKFLMINRFLPKEKPANINSFVVNSLNSNHNFYSFLGEAVFAILMRDIFNYKLSACVLRNTDTLVDSHTGVDSCFYDSGNKKIVLGEAKFYKCIDPAIDTIRKNFIVDDKILNQLDSLFRTALSNKNSKKIILQEAGVKELNMLSFNDFLQMDLIFAGFIMHGDGLKVTADNFKTKCGFTSKDISNNIAARFTGLTPLTYSLIMLHLPVDSKEALIAKIIDKAYEIKEKSV